jgi:hypothetical protein
LGGIGAGRRSGGVGKQAGGTEVCELLEGEVDLPFELSKGRGISSQLLGPEFLLLCEGGLDIQERLLQRRDLLPGLGAKAELHGRILAMARLLDTAAILARKAFPATTFQECTPC